MPAMWGTSESMLHLVSDKQGLHLCKAEIFCSSIKYDMLEGLSSVLLGQCHSYLLQSFLSLCLSERKAIGVRALSQFPQCSPCMTRKKMALVVGCVFRSLTTLLKLCLQDIRQQQGILY